MNHELEDYSFEKEKVFILEASTVLRAENRIINKMPTLPLGISNQLNS